MSTKWLPKLHVAALLTLVEEAVDAVDAVALLRCREWRLFRV